MILFSVLLASLVGCEGESNTSTSDNIVQDVEEAKKPHLYDEEFKRWASKMNAMLSEPMDDPKLKEANNDEGFEYYLKAQEVIREFPNQLLKESKDIDKEHSNLFLLSSYIGHGQFVRTAHLDPNGKAKESTEIYKKWKQADPSMSKAFEYMKQIVNDIDVEVNHNGEGEIYGVTHLLNRKKVSEVEKFVKGE